MDRIKKYILKKGDEELGVTWWDVEQNILSPKEFAKFKEWMSGQTCGYVDDSCAIVVVYTGDLCRFLAGYEPLD